MPVYITPPPRNPIVQLLAAVIAALALAGAFMLGLVALAVVAGLAVIVGVAAWIQGWRVSRRIRQAVDQGHAGNQGEAIEAEYTVISRRPDSD